MREQLWLLPSGQADFALRATVFRPQGSATQRYPLAVINHGTSEANRLAVDTLTTFMAPEPADG